MAAAGLTGLIWKSSPSLPRSLLFPPLCPSRATLHPSFISTKRARSPRKRLNQSSAEAAALLSTISPILFSPAILRRTTYFPVRLPSFPIPDDATLLFREPPSVEKLPVRLEPQMSDYSVCSLPHFEFQDPGSPVFNAESILGTEVEEGIDSIMGMGNLPMSSNCIKDDNLDCLIDFGGLGFGFGISPNIWRALRQKDKGEWWWADVVDVKDIVPKLKVTPVKTKTKKKKEKVENDIAGDSFPEGGILGPRLWLKLDYDEVIKKWSGGSPFFGEAVSVEPATDVIARLACIDLFPNVGGGPLREAGAQRHKEKQRTNLFSKKIGCQGRKGNGEHRPRMKTIPWDTEDDVGSLNWKDEEVDREKVSCINRSVILHSMFLFQFVTVVKRT